MSKSRRAFLKDSALASTGIYLGAMGLSAKSYGNILGANDRVRVGVVGYSDLCNKRREDGSENLKSKFGHDVKAFRNNEELYSSKEVDAVIISTPDFSHARCAMEAVNAKCDVYCEKPFAETMEDARATLKAVKASNRIVQIGSQRRSGFNYHSANDFIKSGKFGDITMVELKWNVNQPARWRRPDVVPLLKEEDTDWKRYLQNRPFEKFDPRKYLEFRLFWPYSSGLPGQWMSHQIDTVHWFSGYSHPRSVVANGGIYKWKDGRRNWDTITAVFDYGPQNDPSTGFQVTFASRMHNGDDDPSEIYFSNGGELNLDTNKVTPKGGLKKNAAAAMKMEPFLLPGNEPRE
jgi:predicted dehydrogenase